LNISWTGPKSPCRDKAPRILGAEPLIDFGRLEPLLHDRLQHFRHDPGDQQQDRSPRHLGDELEHLVQESVDRFRDERNAESLEERHQYEEHDQVEHPCPDTLRDVDAFFMLLRSAKALYPNVQPHLAETFFPDSRDGQRDQPPDYQDRQGAEKTGNVGSQGAENFVQHALHGSPLSALRLIS
jgi:hypothetical protein